MAEQSSSQTGSGMSIADAAKSGLLKVPTAGEKKGQKNARCNTCSCYTSARLDWDFIHKTVLNFIHCIYTICSLYESGRRCAFLKAAKLKCFKPKSYFLKSVSIKSFGIVVLWPQTSQTLFQNQQKCIFVVNIVQITQLFSPKRFHDTRTNCLSYRVSVLQITMLLPYSIK